jgi:hypothetical protein
VRDFSGALSLSLWLRVARVYCRALQALYPSSFCVQASSDKEEGEETEGEQEEGGREEESAPLLRPRFLRPTLLKR